MASFLKPIVYSMLPSIFQSYREYGYQFIFLKNWSGKDDLLLVVAPRNIPEVENDCTIIRRVEKFEDIPERYYHAIIDRLQKDLTPASPNERTKG